MTDKETSQQENPQEQKVACEVCMKEIPASSAKSEEVQDYVLHFCGIDCFDKWKDRGEQGNEE